MSDAAAARRTPDSAPTPQTHDEQTYFLCIDDPYELSIASAWLKATYPNTRGKPVRELPLMRLTERATIIPVIRGEDRSSLEVYDRDSHGAPRVTRRKPVELITEVRECRPVKTADHWRGRADEWDAFGGELMRDSFQTDLAKACTPIAPRVHIGTPNVLRLGFV
jgi:hypothetical protein